jgi:hypothetical protein
MKVLKDDKRAIFTPPGPGANGGGPFSRTDPA